MNLDDILENYPDEQFITINGFDDCILGLDRNSMRLIYSVDQIIMQLTEDMSEEEAIEHFEYNILCAYFGEQTPIYCYDIM